MQTQFEAVGGGAGPLVITLRNSAYDPLYNIGGPSFPQYAAWSGLYAQTLVHKVHLKLMVQNRAATPLWVTTVPSTGVLAATTSRPTLLSLPYQKTYVLGPTGTETAVTSIDCGLMSWKNIAGMSKDEYNDEITGYWANIGSNPGTDVYLNVHFLDLNGYDGTAIVQWQVTYWVEFRNRR